MQLSGIQIEEPAWEISGDYSLEGVLRSLTVLVPSGGTLYVEGGNISPPVIAVLNAHVVLHPTNVYPGTIAPKPLRFHVHASDEVLSQLAKLAEPADVYEGEICDHLVLYSGSHVVLSGYDFGSLPLLLSRQVSEASARRFALGAGGTLAAAV